MIRLKSYDLIMNNTFDRLKSGIYHDNNLKFYSQDFLEKVLNYLERGERYEDCQILQQIIKKRFDHEINYTL